MKKLLLLFLFIPFVFALRGGEMQELLTVNNCIGDIIDITVSATQTIDENEYNITGCNMTSNTIWECPCENPFKVIITTRQNTLNTYILNVEYDIEGNDDNDDGGSSSGGGGGGGGGGGSYTPSTTNSNETDSSVINENDVLDDSTRISQEVIAGADAEVPVVPPLAVPPPANTDLGTSTGLPSGSGGTIIAVIVIVFMIVGGLLLGGYKLLFDAPEEDEFDEDDVDEIVYDIAVEDQNDFNKALATPIVKQVEEKQDMTDEELEDIVGVLRKDDKPKKKTTNIPKIKPTVKDVDDILKHLDD